jgi:hypothetical protein
MRRRIWNHVYDAFRNRRPTRFASALRKYGPHEFEWWTVSSHASVQDALREEQRLIKELRPAYNCTPGGEGYFFRQMSAEAKERLRKVNRGNKYRLGKTHCESTREKLREAGLRNKEKWLLRSHLGSKAMARPVLCLNDGLQFPSASAVARHYGLSRSIVIEMCNRNPRRRTAGGNVFRYADDKKLENKREVEALISGPRRNGKNPHVGVYRHVSEGKDTGKWRARIRFKVAGTRKFLSLGIFATIEQAKAAYDLARQKIEQGILPDG